MKRIKHADLGELILVLEKGKNGFGLFYYIKAEDRFTPFFSTKSEHEAITLFERELSRNRTKLAILNVAKRRVRRGATRVDIQKYRDQLLNTWKDPDIRQFLHYLENMVFE